MRVAAGLFLLLLVLNFRSSTTTYTDTTPQQFSTLQLCSHIKDVNAASIRRSLVAFPANNSVVSNSANVNATWPESSFEAWCMSDSVCSLLPQSTEIVVNLNSSPLGNGSWSDDLLALAVANTTVIALNSTVSNIRTVSELANLTLSYNMKTDTLICDASQPCAATIRFKLSGASLVDPLVCIRLVNNISTGQRQVEGFPVGSDGLTTTGPQVNGYLTCSTTHLGLHAVMQYKIAALPSPPAPPSPAPPPYPPPVAHTTGIPEVPVGSMSLHVVITYALDFNTLTSSSTSVALFTSDTVRYMAQGLAAAFPDLFVNVATSLPYYNRVSLNSISPGSVVAVYTAQLPQGNAQDAVSRVRVFAAAQPAQLLAGSSYQSTVTAAQVYSVEETTGKLKFWQIMAIVIGSVAGAALMIAIAFVLIKRHARSSTIVPDNTSSMSEQVELKKEENLNSDVVPLKTNLPPTPAPTKITILPDSLTIPNPVIESTRDVIQQEAPPSRLSHLMSRASSKSSEKPLPKQELKPRKSTPQQNRDSQQQPTHPQSMPGWCVMPMLVPMQDNGKPIPPFQDLQGHTAVQVMTRQGNASANIAKAAPAQGVQQGAHTALPPRISIPAAKPAVDSYAFQPILQPPLPGQMAYPYTSFTLPHTYPGMAQYTSLAPVASHPQAYYTASQGMIGYDPAQYAGRQADAQSSYMYSMYPPLMGFANQGQAASTYTTSQNVTLPAYMDIAKAGVRTKQQVFDKPSHNATLHSQ